MSVDPRTRGHANRLITPSFPAESHATAATPRTDPCQVRPRPNTVRSGRLEVWRRLSARARDRNNEPIGPSRPHSKYNGSCVGLEAPKDNTSVAWLHFPRGQIRSSDKTASTAQRCGDVAGGRRHKAKLEKRRKVVASRPRSIWTNFLRPPYDAAYSAWPPYLSRSHARDPYRLSELLGLAPAYFGYFVPTLATRPLNPCPFPLFAPCLRSLCIVTAFRVRRRYCVGQVIRTVKRAFWCLRTFGAS
jgi:hypothetical protein